jgi:hypothetical protein
MTTQRVRVRLGLLLAAESNPDPTQSNCAFEYVTESFSMAASFRVGVRVVGVGLESLG